MTNGSRTTFFVYCVFLTLSLTAKSSYGAWDLLPELDLIVETDDNPRLRAEGLENEASRTALDARVGIMNFGERGTIYFQPRVRSSAYADSDDDDLDDDEIFLRGYGEYNWTSSTIGFYSNSERQNIRNAEFRSASPLDPDIADPIDPGTGLTSFTNGRREALWLTPYYQFDLSDRNSVLLELTHSDVIYTGAASRGRSDFVQNEFSAGLVRSVGEITEVTARVFVSEFEADENDNVTDTVGVEGNFIQPLGATWTMEVTAGVQRNDYSFTDFDDFIENADTNVVLAFGFRKRTDRTRINFDLDRAIYPSGSGFVSEINEASVWVERRFTERLTGSIGAAYERTKTVDEISTVNDRDYKRIDIELRWALNEHWSLSAGYDITDQEFKDQLDSRAKSRVLFFGVSFQGEPTQYF